jgi:hypothetical protein
MTTVWIYVDTSTILAIPDHLKARPAMLTAQLAAGVQNCVSRLSKQISGLRVIQRTLKCRGFSFRFLL